MIKTFHSIASQKNKRFIGSKHLVLVENVRVLLINIILIAAANGIKIALLTAYYFLCL